MRTATDRNKNQSKHPHVGPAFRMAATNSWQRNGHVFTIPHQRTSRHEFMGRIVRFPNLYGHARKEWPRVGKTSLLSLLSASTSVALTSWRDFNRVKGH